MPNLYDESGAYDAANAYDGGTVRFAKFYGSDNHPTQQPFRWSKAWEDEFARRRRDAVSREVRERVEDYDREALAAWREAEDEDLLLAASSSWYD